MGRKKNFIELRVTLSADTWCVKLSGAATVMLCLLAAAGTWAVWAVVGRL